MKSFIEEVAATPGGEGVYGCIQCGVCTGSCPSASKMEHPMRKTIAMIRAGMRDEVLSSGSMWYCLSCYMCTVRCPRGVKPAELAHTLEALSAQHGFDVKGTDTPVMYRSFVNSIKDSGRVNELGMMIRFYLRAGRAPMKLLPVALNLLGYGRIPPRPHGVKDSKKLARILQKFAEIRGAQ